MRTQDDIRLVRIYEHENFDQSERGHFDQASNAFFFDSVETGSAFRGNQVVHNDTAVPTSKMLNE